MLAAVPASVAPDDARTKLRTTDFDYTPYRPDPSVGRNTVIGLDTPLTEKTPTRSRPTLI